jgi:hypothetical protein
MPSEMYPSYYLAHPTDDVLGRTGTTIDWPKSIPNFDPKNWNGYVQAPPLNSSWPELLYDDLLVVAKNAVKPFALHHIHETDLLLLAEPIFQSMSESSRDDTFSNVEPGIVRFGKKEFKYRFCSLRHNAVLSERHFPSQCTFSSINFRDHHILGTRIQRGQPFEKELQVKLMKFKNYEEYRLRKTAHLRDALILASSPFGGCTAPLLFATPLRLYVHQQVRVLIEQLKHPGVSFPYEAIQPSGTK